MLLWGSHDFGVVIVIEGGVEIGLGFNFLQFGLECVFVMLWRVVMGVDIGEKIVIFIFSQESL
jgi:hypothetical protein